MLTALKTGRFFYGLGIIADGLQQLLVRDFRPQIIPTFPAWAHRFLFFPLVTGVALIVCGAVLAGILKSSRLSPKRVSLFLGGFFLVLIFTCQLPYLFFVYPYKLSHLGSWGDLLKELAFCGGALVLAGSYPEAPVHKRQDSFVFPHQLFPAGRLFFCTTMILFGCCHFAYAASISLMVPGWLGIPVFWTYFGGVALIGAGVALASKMLLQPVSLLLATMLFLWFFLVHVPGVVAHPFLQNGNPVVSAFDALLFCGTALVLSQSAKKDQTRKKDVAWRRNHVNKTVRV